MTWLWNRLLLTLDRLLGTQLVEWELARKQAQIEQLTGRLETVNQGLSTLAQEMARYQLLLCLVELQARSERDDLEDWLRFAPHSDGDEALLDGAIACLVKPRLASVDVAPDGPGRYVYRLRPHWSAIVARLSDEAVAPELMSWLAGQTV